MNRSTHIRASIPVVLLLTLLPVRILSGSADASAPGFTDEARLYTPTLLPERSVNPIPTGVAGGILFFVRHETKPDGCTRDSLRFTTEPAQIATLLAAGLRCLGIPAHHGERGRDRDLW